MSQFWKLSKCNFFTFKDKRGLTYDHKLIRKWPSQLTSKGEFIEILNALRPHDSEENKNLLTQLYEDIKKSDDLKLVFKGSLERTRLILRLDDENEQTITDLMEPEEVKNAALE